MKILKCKIMGEFSSLQCYDCFKAKMAKQNYESRVVCKRNNIVEEMTISDKEEIELSLNVA